jgi:hypothetical protein
MMDPSRAPTYIAELAELAELAEMRFLVWGFCDFCRYVEVEGPETQGSDRC